MTLLMLTFPMITFITTTFTTTTFITTFTTTTCIVRFIMASAMLAVRSSVLAVRSSALRTGEQRGASNARPRMLAPRSGVPNGFVIEFA